MISSQASADLLGRLQSSGAMGAPFRKEAMRVLAELPGYDWSGIYRMENGGLVLDEYEGEQTEHTHIAVGVGVCGTAVAEDRNVLVEDVRKLDNYLSCSIQTRSEIVVLIRRGGEVLGQIDVDGHSVGAFDASDERFLDTLAELISERW